MAMMEKLVNLRDPISVYFRVHPDMAHLGLSSEEWRILTEVCGVLDLFKYVNTAMEGGTADRFIARSVFLCNTLLELLGDGTTNIINHCGVAGASGVHTPITDLHGTTTNFIKIAVEDLKQRNVHVPETEVELLGMFLDPRYKSLDGDACGGEGHAERLTLALANLRDSLNDRFLAFPSPPAAAAEPTVRPATGAAAVAAVAATTSSKRPAELDEDPFAEYSRKRKKRAAAAASAAAVLCTVANRFEKEIAEYKSLPDITGSKFDLLSFWEDAAKPRLDENGNVVEVARFPILAMLARVFHSADTTSCQPEKGTASFISERGTAGVQSGRDAAGFHRERELSEVVRGMRNLRKSMRRDGIETMMFLKLNQRLIPEVHSHAQQ